MKIAFIREAKTAQRFKISRGEIISVVLEEELSVVNADSDGARSSVIGVLE